MKLPLATFLSAALLALCGASPLLAADQSPSPGGYWAGAISLPNQELPIAVELSTAEGDAWQGTIDIPMQGLRGYRLDPVKISGSSVEFGLPGIPGDPRFSGQLATDAKTIAGEFQQGGGSLPFRLERKPKPAPEIREAVPARGTPGKGLPGKWRGAIAPAPNVELRLELEAELDAAGKLTGVLVSLDQGNARIPVSGMTETEGKVHFDVPDVQGGFTGTLSADGSDIAGEWSQLGRSTPLVFKRLPGIATP